MHLFCTHRKSNNINVADGPCLGVDICVNKLKPIVPSAHIVVCARKDDTWPPISTVSKYREQCTVTDTQ